ncbi:MAG: MSMEG_4193 family putative phosphomutase [Anaerolineales bacterium]|nr:MSMEG_4193 family putative phosphomutase [Anaerolineales bacterium]MCA9929837.1 MSMEG_4193 family putative phosphomutase [Anaerolineales bacterium]
MATIILVRHGENEWVKKHRLAGWIPGVHLNEQGHKQAEQLAQRLAPLPIEAVYSSPVTRCMETAVYIANSHQKEIIPLEAVGEVRYGDWEGKKIRKLARLPLWRVVQFFPSRMQFPNGEALREVQFRAIQALETLSKRHENKMIVVASHADLIKLVLAHYLGIHIDLFQRIVISPASASLIHLPGNGMVRVSRINDDGPLQAPKPAESASISTKKKKSRKIKKVRIKKDK